MEQIEVITEKERKRFEAEQHTYLPIKCEECGKIFGDFNPNVKENQPRYPFRVFCKKCSKKVLIFD